MTKRTIVISAWSLVIRVKLSFVDTPKTEKFVDSIRSVKFVFFLAVSDEIQMFVRRELSNQPVESSILSVVSTEKVFFERNVAGFDPSFENETREEHGEHQTVGVHSSMSIGKFQAEFDNFLGGQVDFIGFSFA